MLRGEVVLDKCTFDETDDEIQRVIVLLQTPRGENKKMTLNSRLYDFIGPQQKDLKIAARYVLHAARIRPFQRFLTVFMIRQHVNETKSPLELAGF